MRTTAAVAPNDFLLAYFADVRVRVRRMFATCALYALLATWTAIAIALPIAGAALAPGRATSLALLAGGALLALLALIAAIVVGIVVPLRRYADDAAIARWIGARAKPVASDLLSAVELQRRTDDGAVRSTAWIRPVTASWSERTESSSMANTYRPRGSATSETMRLRCTFWGTSASGADDASGVCAATTTSRASR